MKRLWAGILAWLVVVCLLWSLAVVASINPCEKYSQAGPRESRSLPSCRDLRLLSRCLIHSRAGPQEYSFTTGRFLRVQDLGPAGPPWLEYRGPPENYLAPGRIARLPVAMVAPLAGRNAFLSNFAGLGGPN